MIGNLFSTISEMLSFTFMMRAAIVGVMVSLCASLLGVSLVLKRYAMIGTGLSHVGFMALIVAAAVDFTPLFVSLPVVLGAAFLLLRLNENNKIKGDSAVALISASSFAIGVILASQTTGMGVHTCTAMFGSILATTRADVQISVGLSVAVILLFVLSYKQIFAITHDEDFAQATGTKAGLYKTLLALLTAVTVVLGMRMMGALLISSLIIFPALTAMRLCRSFLSVVIVSAIIGVVCFFIGITISYGLDWPTGATVVAVNLAVFIIFSAVGAVRKGGFS